MAQVTEQVVAQRIKEKLGNVEHLVVTDESSGCGAKFSVLVVSDSFVGKPPVDRHRMVNDALKEEMKTIHALSLKTLTKQQWEKKKNES